MSSGKGSNKDNPYYANRTLESMRSEIERFIDAYDGTAIGEQVKNMYENSSGTIDSICSIMDVIDNIT